MDSQPEVLGAHLLGSTDASNTKASSSSKKRGIIRGVSLHVQHDRKKVLKMNEFGKLNEDCPDHRDFALHISVLTRTYISIIYRNFRQVPHAHIQMVIETLSQFYEFEGQCWDASLIYVTQRINEAWRNYKKRLTAKYIKNKDPIAVRDSPAPPGIPMEDWRVFVDQHATEEFKRASARNKVNRAKLKGTACLGRCSLTVIRHQMLVGSDSRGRMRGLGCSITKIGLKKSASARSKVEMVTKEKESLAQEIFEMKKTLDDIKATLVDMKALVDMQKEAQYTQNLSSPPATRSTQASSPDIICIGKRCDLLGFGKRGVVAHGQVHEVNPNAVDHCEQLEDGAFVVVLTEVVQPDAPLWKEDGFASTLGEAGLGSFVQWGKESLRIQ